MYTYTYVYYDKTNKSDHTTSFLIKFMRLFENDSISCSCVAFFFRNHFKATFTHHITIESI